MNILVFGKASPLRIQKGGTQEGDGLPVKQSQAIAETTQENPKISQLSHSLSADRHCNWAYLHGILSNTIRLNSAYVSG